MSSVLKPNLVQRQTRLEVCVLSYHVYMAVKSGH
jgi:hypothetical protein